MEREKDSSGNIRFYILISFLLLISVVMSYFNLKMKTLTPTFENANYDNILKHINMLKKSKRYLKNKK